VSGRRFTDAKALLHDLLDRHEARPAVKRLSARVDDAGFASVREEDACMARLEAAERAGGIFIVRRRVDGVDRVQRVTLANAEALYDHLQRVPSHQTIDDALSDVRRGAAHDVQGVLDEIAEGWQRNVSCFGLAPGEVSALKKALALMSALQARGANLGTSEVDYRTFSRAVVGDSKALDRLKGPVVRLLGRLSPATTPGGLDKADVLSSLGVVRIPQPILASGPLALDGTPTPPMIYVGVPPDAVEILTLTRGVEYALIIENFTSFVRHCRELNTDQRALILYSGGFPSRAALRGIVHLAVAAQAPTFHWGDIDPGGLKIFRHLEVALGEVGVALKPHLMDKALLVQGEEQPKLTRLKLGGATGSAIAGLWDSMARDPDHRGLEQEALNPTAPVCGATIKVRAQRQSG